MLGSLKLEQKSEKALTINSVGRSALTVILLITLSVLRSFYGFSTSKNRWLSSRTGFFFSRP